MLPVSSELMATPLGICAPCTSLVRRILPKSSRGSECSSGVRRAGGGAAGAQAALQDLAEHVLCAGHGGPGRRAVRAGVPCAAHRGWQHSRDRMLSIQRAEDEQVKSVHLRPACDA